MEGWRQRRLGAKAKNPQKKKKTVSTLTDVLMERVGTMKKKGKVCLAGTCRRYHSDTPGYLSTK
jgi:hypothetical protein